MKEKNIRLLNDEHLVLELNCPYCGTRQYGAMPVKNYRPVGTMIRCRSCKLVWKIGIYIKNHPLADQQECIEAVKEGWKATFSDHGGIEQV